MPTAARGRPFAPVNGERPVRMHGPFTTFFVIKR